MGDIAKELDKLLDIAELTSPANNQQQDVISDDESLREAVINIANQNDCLITREQSKFLLRTMRTPILSPCFDYETCTLNDIGKELIERTVPVRPDLVYLFTYCGKFTKRPKYNDIIPEKLDPFTYYQFMHEMIDSYSTMESLGDEEKGSYSRFLKNLLLQSKQLSECESISKLNIALVKLARTIPGVNLELLKPNIQECVVSSIYHDFSFKEKDWTNLETIVQGKDELSNDGNFSDYIHSCTYLHDLIANQFDKKDSRERSLMLTDFYFRGVLKKEIVGYVHLNVQLKWKPKFADSNLSKKCFLNFKYDNITFRVPFKDTTPLDLIIPITDDKNLTLFIDYTLYKYENKDNDSPSTRGTLIETKIKISNQDQKEEFPFNRRKSKLSAKCGILTINTEFHDVNTPFDIPSTKKKMSSSGISAILKNLCTNLVRSWMSSSPMPILPPAKRYISIMNFATMYYIPASTVFSTIMDVMKSHWNEAGSFINAFTLVFFASYMASKNCNSPFDMDPYIDFVRETIPPIFVQRIMAPYRFENDAIVSIFMLYSFISEPDVIEDYIDGIIDRVRTKILHTITSKLEPIPTDKYDEAAEQIMPFIPVNRSSVNVLAPTKKSSSKSQMNGSFTFDCENVFSAFQVLSMKLNGMKKYYESHTLPLFLDNYKILRSTLATLLAAFGVIMGRFTEDEKYFDIEMQFIMPYREAWAALELPEKYSPFKLLFGVLVTWINEISGKMIEWITNAIKIDDFEIENNADKTSSSIVDMYTVFGQTISFLESLHWNNREQMSTIISSYFSVCGNLARDYHHNIFALAYSYFSPEIIQTYLPKDIIANFVTGRVIDRVISPKQIFIIINDAVRLFSTHKKFLEINLPRFTEYDIPSIDNFMHTIPNSLDVAVKSLPILFAGVISKDVYNNIYPHLFIPNKKAILRKASPNILNPNFEDRSSELFIQLFDQTIAYVKPYFESLKTNVCHAFYKKLLRAFIHGVEIGLLNLMLDDPPIKHKRLIVIIQFVQDIIKDLFEFISTGDREITKDEFCSYTPFATFLFQNDGKPIKELIKMDPGVSNVQQSMCVYILIGSQESYDKAAKKWVKEEGIRFSKRKFVPSSQLVQS